MDKDVEELLSRGVDKIYPSKEALAEALASGKKLKLYQGFDPTGDKLHLGHLAGLLKLRDWQQLGHEVIFLMGTGTGQAGDPSGKTKSRDTFFNAATLRSNAEKYVKPVSNFLNQGKIDFKYNGDWLDKVTIPELLQVVGNFSLQQLIERDLFQERIKNGEPLNMREALYPFLQAYDSVIMDVDLEIGGSDQTFNMLFGRTLMKAMKGKEKFVMTTPLIADSSGKKIGKTEGNVIAVFDSSQKLYAQIMSLPDEIIVKCLECLTRVPMARVREIEKAIQSGENPMVYKKELAFAVVSLTHDQKEAQEAQEIWEDTFSKGNAPKDVKTVEEKAETPLVEILLKHGIVSSKTEFNRLSKDSAIEEMENGVYRVGKHRFLKIVRID